jgi:hypothetical protein
MKHLQLDFIVNGDIQHQSSIQIEEQEYDDLKASLKQPNPQSSTIKIMQFNPNQPDECSDDDDEEL